MKIRTLLATVVASAALAATVGAQAAYAGPSKVAADPPCPNCTLAGVMDWDSDLNSDLIARDDATGTLWLYPGTPTGRGFKGPRQRLGENFGGVTFAGVGHWEGRSSVAYRIDSGPEAGDVYAWAPDDPTSWRIFLGGGFGGVTFAGVADLDRNHRNDIVYRVDGGTDRGVLYATDSQSRRVVGTGFAGATFAGIKDWDSNDAADVIYRVDGGAENGHLYALGSSRLLIGTGFSGALFADVATWGSGGVYHVLYRLGRDLWAVGPEKYRVASPF